MNLPPDLSSNSTKGPLLQRRCFTSTRHSGSGEGSPQQRKPVFALIRLPKTGLLAAAVSLRPRVGSHNAAIRAVERKCLTAMKQAGFALIPTLTRGCTSFVMNGFH